MRHRRSSWRLRARRMPQPLPWGGWRQGRKWRSLL